jgi:hypothetical protein
MDAATSKKQAVDSGSPDSGVKDQSGQTPDEKSSWLLQNIADASQNTAQIYFLYIGALIYCALTVVSISDERLVLDQAVQLPLINLEVSCTGFFILAPLVLIFLFVYLQLYIARAKGLIVQLKASVHKLEKRRLYPWLLNIAESPDPNPIGWIQKAIAKLSLWWLLPMVLVLFAIVFIKKHDPVLSYVISGLPLVGIGLVLWFHSLLHGQEYSLEETDEAAHKNSKLLHWLLLVIPAASLFLFELFLLFYLVPVANSGKPPGRLWSRTCVNLSFRNLVTQPKDEDSKSLYWIDLRDAHLEGARLSSAILKRANLSGAYLNYAVLDSANLEAANLEGAHLEGANLSKANLQGTILDRASLSGTILKKAHLQNASLSSAQAENADFSGADMRCVTATSANWKNAKLASSNLMQAYFVPADNLTSEQLATVRTLYKFVAIPQLSGAVALRPDLQEQPQPDYAGEDASNFLLLTCTSYPKPGQ